VFYLSDVTGKKIYDPQGNVVARIRDFVAELVPAAGTGSKEADKSHAEGEGKGEAEARPDDSEVLVIKGLVADRGRGQKPFFIPVEQVASIDTGGVRLATHKLDLKPFEQRPGELLLARNLWDKQVVDLQNHKVVRVNDVLISDTPLEIDSSRQARWWVRGVDVRLSLSGILRRLHLARLFGILSPTSPPADIVPWKYVVMFGSNVPGGFPVQHSKLAALHPVEIARITDSVSYRQGAEIISSLNDTLAADTLEEIDESRQTDIVEQIPDERAADILEEMSPDEATDLLADLPDDKANSLLRQMDKQDAEEIRRLLRYPDDTAGGMMNTVFVKVLPTQTVGEVIESNKEAFGSADLIYYIYVVDPEDEQRLVGIITVRDLLVHDRGTKIGDIMLKDLIVVTPDESQKEVARKMAEYNLMALPVVDDSGRLLGVVTADDALDALLPEGWKRRIPRIFS
jgi:CBS domain-containing protein